MAAEIGNLFRDYSLLLPDEASLDAATIRQAAKDALQVDVEPQIVPTTTDDFCFAFPFEGQRVWVAVGQAPYRETNWKDAIEDEGLRDVVLKSKSWLAVGNARWVHKESDELGNGLLRLASRLAGNKATSIYHSDHWKLAILDDRTRELLASAEPRGALRVVGVQVYGHSADDDVVARRSFRRDWRDAVRMFNAEQGPSLRIRIGVSIGSVSEPLWLRVQETRRHYGEIEAVGRLEDHSQLIRELKPGLPLRISDYEIEAFQLGEGEIRKAAH